MPEVRPERTGWRDEGLSRRHRLWGWDCPAVDIDFLLLEYNHGRASALVEYKSLHAGFQDTSHPTYRALADLGNRAGIPVLICYYTDDFAEYWAAPLNYVAKRFLADWAIMTEQQWVGLLYRIRGYEVPQEVLNGIHAEKGVKKQ